jgi:hypothetical protein
MHHPMDRRFIGGGARIETSLTVAATEAQRWTYDRVSCISGKSWDTKYLKVSDFGLKPIQAVGSDNEVE